MSSDRVFIDEDTPKVFNVTLSKHEQLQLDYIEPIWNARRKLDNLRAQTPEEILGELLGIAMGAAVRRFRQHETAQLGALMASANDTTRELVRQALGILPPPPLADEARLIDSPLARDLRAPGVDGDE